MLHMISGPRNISTALMYSFGNRSDCHVIDEPFYGYYLKITDVDHPGKKEVMESMSCSATDVIREVIHAPYEAPLVFIKDMAHHFIGLDPEFILSHHNIFLVRNTEHILISLAKVIDNPSIDDIGIKKEWELYNYLVAQGKNPVVIDSGLLLENPRSVLKQLCNHLAISFDENMLSWEAGARKEDGVWAPYWYKNVHKTTGFKKQSKSQASLPDHLQKVHQEAYIYYDKFLAKAIRP